MSTSSKPSRPIITTALVISSLLIFGSSAIADEAVKVNAAEKSPYMGGEVNLIKAPNGAVVREEVATTGAQITYLEPTTEKLADGVWVIGGYSLANTTVIEADDGLIVYDTGDTKEEAEHILEAIKKISDKPIKVIIYSHSHYAMGGGALVDNPDDVLIIGHPKVNETVESSLKGGGSPSAIPEVGPRMTSRLLIQFNNFIPTEGPDAALAGKLELGKPASWKKLPGMPIGGGFKLCGGMAGKWK